jgi:hypothetical protein
MKKASSFKLQAACSPAGFFKKKKDLTAGEGSCRMNLERNNYGQ